MEQKFLSELDYLPLSSSHFLVRYRLRSVFVFWQCIALRLVGLWIRLLSLLHWCYSIAVILVQVEVIIICVAIAVLVFNFLLRTRIIIEGLYRKFGLIVHVNMLAIAFLLFFEWASLSLGRVIILANLCYFFSVVKRDLLCFR